MLGVETAAPVHLPSSDIRARMIRITFWGTYVVAKPNKMNLPLNPEPYTYTLNTPLIVIRAGGHRNSYIIGTWTLKVTLYYTFFM